MTATRRSYPIGRPRPNRSERVQQPSDARCQSGCRHCLQEDPMRTLPILAIAAVPMLMLAAPAAAAAPTLAVHPGSVNAGGSVQVTGSCQANTTGYAISHAFLHDASHDFAGVGAVPFNTNASGTFAVTAQVPASIAAGSYSITARCGGGNLGVSATLTVTAGSDPASAPPTAVPAGTGGLAATGGSGISGQLELLGGAGLLAGAGLLLAARRRTA